MIEHLRNEEAKIVHWLNKFRPNRSNELAHLYTGQLLMAVCRHIETTPFQTLEDIPRMFEHIGDDTTKLLAKDYAAELVEFAYEELLAIAQERLAVKLKRHANAGANKALYVPEQVFRFYKLGETWRWEFRPEFRSEGLLSLIVKDLHGFQEAPVAIGIQLDALKPTDGAPQQPDENVKQAHQMAMDRMVTKGVAVSKGRLGWNMKSPGWGILLKCFPKAIDFSAYCHSLSAPVLPEGFMKASVTFKVLRDNMGVDLGTDGSGIYHPDCPEMQPLIAKYGLVAFQLRVVHPQSGTFAKGIVFPSELATGPENQPMIVMDWLQIKGRWKALAKQRRASNEIKLVAGCYIGMLQAWSKPAKLSGCFEFLENIRHNPVTSAIVQSLVARAMAALEARGVDGLVMDVAKKDDTIKIMTQLVQVGRNEGLDFHAYQIPRVAEAVADKLSRRLYVMAQGAGLRLPSFVCRMDATVPRGRCVISGMRDGKDVVGFRFPLILPQGLLTLRTINPRPHHLIKGEMPPNVVVLNPFDCAMAQGDDDGDIFGFTDSPELVQLFRHKLDESKFLIEPAGVEILGPDGTPLQTDSPEGLKFIQRDHRDNVGRVTIYRSRLLAVGDYDGARALSIAIQECIDQAKRKVEWTNYFHAANLGNWTARGDAMECTVKFTPSELENGEFPMDKIRDWVNQRLIQRGCCKIVTGPQGDQQVKAENPLWWRAQGKRIDIAEWSIPAEDSEFSAFENLVHLATRHAYKLWTSIEDKFLTNKHQLDLSTLLPVILAVKSVPVNRQKMDPQEYDQIRSICGINTYNASLKSVLSRPADTEASFNARTRALANAQQELETSLARAIKNQEITVDDLCSIWEHETSEGGNINDAFRCICWPGSPVLTLLGIPMQQKCRFLATKVDGERTRLEVAVTTALQDSKPFDRLREIIEINRTHAAEVKDANGDAIGLHECPECLNLLQQHAVRTLRTRKQSAERQWLLALHQHLKG